MERSFLKALGLTAEQIDSVFVEYGREQNDWKAEKQALNQTISTLQAKENELKAYQKGGEKYSDPEELKTLREFKATVESEKKTKAQKDTAEEIFKNYKDKKFLTELYHSKIDLDENGKAKNTADILKSVKEKFPGLEIVTGNEGTQTKGNDYGGEKKDTSVPLVL